MSDEAAMARVALTTTGSVKEAQTIAWALVERRLAACVNLLPGITSIYRWQGAVEKASETLLLIKTTAERISAVEAAIRELHSYTVPEFLVLPVTEGSQSYLDWLLASVEK